MKNKVLLTKESYEELKKELKILIEVDRPFVIKQLQDAREQGDLSENADYDAAKEKQIEMEKRITEIQFSLENSLINNGKDIKGIVSVYNHVKIYDEVEKKSFTYQIVGTVESDPDNFKISNESALAKAILGHKVNDVVEVKGVDFHYKVKIEDISNK